MPVTRMFEPGTIGSLRVKNRLVMPAMATNFASAHGEPTPRMLAYYGARAAGGVGTIVIENASIDEPAGGNGTVQLCIDHDRYVPGLSQLVRRVQEAGAAVAIQINHAGAIANPGRTGAPAVGPSDVGWTAASPHPTALTLDGIERIIERYADAAMRAKRAGFDAVEVHGAHGYLIAQFLSPITNRRVDAYGGSTENRWRFAIDVVRAVREAVGAGYPILFRLSGDEFMPGGRGLDESTERSASLVDAGVDALHVSAGTSANPEVQLEPVSYEEGWRAYLSAAIRKRISIPVITVGVFRHPETVERALEQGAADFVAIGRGLIADPDWPRKVQAARGEAIRHCISCNRCVRQRVFDDLPIRCSVNPRVGFEDEAEHRASEEGVRRVVVVGGGPAGIQAAMAAHEAGADVTLFERGGTLGGQLRAAACPPHKDKITWLIDDLTRAIPAEVDVRLETNATKHDIDTLAPDAVVIATGATSAPLDVPTDPNATVQSAESLLLASDDLAGMRIAVIGAGMVGCETALACAERGGHVVLVEALAEVGRDCEPISRSVLIRHLDEAGVRIVRDARVTEIKKDAVTVEVEAGREDMPADRVVIAIGAAPADRLGHAWEGEALPVFLVGDARAARGIAEAVYEGWRAGQSAARAPKRTPNGEEG